MLIIRDIKFWLCEKRDSTRNSGEEEEEEGGNRRRRRRRI